MVIVSLSTACNLNLTSKKDPQEWGQWGLISIDGDAGLVRIPPSALFEGGKISGSAGCNSYQGSYAVQGDSLAIGPLVRTEIYCQNPLGVMKQEDRYMEILVAADSFIFEEGRLKISVYGVQLEF